MTVARKWRWIPVALLLAVAVAWLATPLVVDWMRADITDAAELAALPLRKLRDAELETLLRAAIREADELTIESEGNHRLHVPFRRVVVTDRAELNRLADSFAISHDETPLPEYPYPGLMYTRLKFAGPYRPDFVFADQKRILFYGYGHDVEVASKFRLAVAEAVGLREKRDPIERRREQERMPFIPD